MEKIDDILKGIKSVAMSGHIRPDGDAIGSSLAVYNYIKDNYPDIKADIYLDEVPDVYAFLPGTDEIKTVRPDGVKYDLFIALDCGDLGRLGDSAKYFESADKTLCVDHHMSNKSFADVNYIFPDASSACQLVYKLLDETKVTKEIAECLYTGMVTDSGIFQYSSTTSETMNIAGKLMDTGIDFNDIVDKVWNLKTYAQNRVLGKCLNDSRLYLDGALIISYITKDEMKEYGVNHQDFEGISSQLRNTAGVKVAAFLSENDDGSFKISLRSNGANVAAIAENYGGGGHMRAAGATAEGRIEDIIEELIKNTEKVI
nr:bifunctional oligoribonuclease/PAP phosphatase NrnA [Eubacterium sp.]